MDWFIGVHSKSVLSLSPIIVGPGSVDAWAVIGCSLVIFGSMGGGAMCNMATEAGVPDSERSLALHVFVEPCVFGNRGPVSDISDATVTVGLMCKMVIYGTSHEACSADACLVVDVSVWVGLVGGFNCESYSVTLVEAF